MTPTPVTDTAAPDRALLIEETHRDERSVTYSGREVSIPDVTSEVQRDTIAALRADYMRLLEEQSEERGEWDAVITERDALRTELAATVARNIELEKKRVSLEAEVDRLRNELDSFDYGITHGVAMRPKPQPKRRPWNCPADVPMPVCWVRHTQDRGISRLVIATGAYGISLGGSLGFVWAKAADYEYSTNGRDWQPCEVEHAT